MSHKVEGATALAVLTKAAKEATRKNYRPRSVDADVIKQIITGSHLTYRYILLTALLAKATNPKINPLAIQATAAVTDAYDARSLCHSIIVPNEADLLHSALGSSNEPYLNKPARVPFLDKSNPVRQGKDSRTLEALCQFLSKMATRELADTALRDAVFFAVDAIVAKNAAVSTAVEGMEDAPTDIRGFLETLLSETHHGETTVLVTALLYWLLSQFKAESWTIEVHPVNEAGSSSNQVGDIDVYRGQDLLYTCEVKDKVVISNDIHHAIRKASEARSEMLHIVLGKNGRISDANPQNFQLFAKKHNIALTIFESTALVEASAIWTPVSLSLKELASKAIEISEVSRMKHDSQRFLLKTIQAFARKGRQQ